MISWFRLRLPVILAGAVLLATHSRAHESAHLPSRDGTMLDAVLLKPAGQGPHPAAILLHGCGGRDGRDGRLDPRHADWAERLVQAGFVVLLPESFTSRGQGPQCAVRDRRILPWRERRADALGARDWLAAQPFVRADAIALMGWSHGGSTVLAAADAPGFAGFVAFYPGCSRALRAASFAPAAPLLLLIGEADDWTPPAPCRALAGRAGPVVTYVGYPGVYHGFDAPDSRVRLRTGLAFTVRGDGTAHVGTDPAARADAIARVPAWLAERVPR